MCRCGQAGVVVLMALNVIWYIIAVATPWAYIKTRTPDCCLGISQTGMKDLPAHGIPTDLTCSVHTFEVNIFKGLCHEEDGTSCRSLRNRAAWRTADFDNTMYLHDFYDTVENTHFEEDTNTWGWITGLVLGAAALYISFFLVFLGFNYNLLGMKLHKNSTDSTLHFTNGVIVTLVNLVSAVLCIVAMVISLDTSLLSPLKSIEGGNYALSLNVWSYLNYGCMGSYYVAGPGIVCSQY